MARVKYSSASIGGKGLGKSSTAKRHRKILRDTLHGVTKGDIRRLARRGGVKRISATMYVDVRLALRERLERILKHIGALLDYRKRKTVTVSDVVFTLNTLGSTIYGFGEVQGSSGRGSGQMSG